MVKKKSARRRWASEAMRDVMDERRRQMAKGFTRDHDDAHTNHEMAAAASCYVTVVASTGRLRTHGPENLRNTMFTPEQWAALPMPYIWPWDPSSWRPETMRASLIKAAALCVAEVERLDRAHARAILTGSRIGAP